MRYLTFALTKGRLASKTLDMFEKIGITCEEMRDKDSRKLIFTNEELKLKFFLAKGPDVPTYVEYGAADIGIVGKDTILEAVSYTHLDVYKRQVNGKSAKYRMSSCGYSKPRICVSWNASTGSWISLQRVIVPRQSITAYEHRADSTNTHTYEEL